ncbi:actin-associated protein FAM107A isoform 2-T2 [Menidia menidia]
MGVTHGKKRELTHRTPETHVNQPAPVSQMHPSEQRRFSELEILSSQIQNEEESSTLIKPHKPLSPFNASRSHKALHKELQMTHKRRVAQEGKTELQRALEKRRWEQKIKARQDQEETKRNMSPLQQELLKRQQRRENQMEKDETIKQEEPEFLRVKESLRRTTVLHAAGKEA